MTRTIHVDKAWGSNVNGPVLVMREGFSPRYDLNRVTGIITRIGHSAEGQSVKGKILVIPTAKGGVAGGWAFLDLLHRDIAPLALVFGKLNPVMVQGAVLAGMPITEGWSENLSSILKNGQTIEIRPADKYILITE